MLTVTPRNRAKSKERHPRIVLIMRMKEKPGGMSLNKKYLMKWEFPKNRAAVINRQLIKRKMGLNLPSSQKRLSPQISLRETPVKRSQT